METDTKTISFGHIQIPASQMFFETEHVFGLVNLKPIADGHVLICTKNKKIKLSELSNIETFELWKEIKNVSKVLEEIYKKKCIIAVQNGKDAGQTVEHVHAHIVPIKENEIIENIDDCIFFL